MRLIVSRLNFMEQSGHIPVWPKTMKYSFGLALRSLIQLKIRFFSTVWEVFAIPRHSRARHQYQSPVLNITSLL
jgi:hypothetical protein